MKEHPSLVPDLSVKSSLSPLSHQLLAFFVVFFFIQLSEVPSSAILLSFVMNGCWIFFFRLLSFQGCTHGIWRFPG